MLMGCDGLVCFVLNVIVWFALVQQKLVCLGQGAGAP